MTSETVNWSTTKLVASTLRTVRERKGLELIKRLADAGEEMKYHAHYLKSSDSTLSQWGRWRHLREIEELANENLFPVAARLIELQPKMPEWGPRLGRIAGAAKTLATDAKSAIQASSTVPAARVNISPASLFGRIGKRADALVRVACTGPHSSPEKAKADKVA